MMDVQREGRAGICGFVRYKSSNALMKLKDRNITIGPLHE